MPLKLFFFRNSNTVWDSVETFLSLLYGLCNRVLWCFYFNKKHFLQFWCNHDVFLPLSHLPSCNTLQGEPTKLPRMSASKRATKAPPSYTKISFLFFCDVFRFTSSRIASRYLLSFLFSWSLTLIFLLMILTVHSQITLTVSGFKCFH